MKKLFILALVICPLLAFAQLLPKYGTVKPEEFNLRPTTPNDSAADVYVLYHSSDVWFELSGNTLYLEREVNTTIPCVERGW